MRRETIAHTFKVATLLCVVCSVLVSGAAVGLRPAQERNKTRNMRKNVLIAAGLFHEGKDRLRDVDERFARIETRAIDLSQGVYTDTLSPDSVPEPAKYDQREAARDPKLSDRLPRDEDIAGIKRREKYSLVYLVKTPEGRIDQYVLPIRGYGLWSTLYGFLSIDADTTTIRGLTFYEHAETPGLGGEVDNPLWKAKWSSPQDVKKVYGPDWKVRIEVIKGTVSPNDPNRPYKVDGLSGATLTTRGLHNMLRFWLGEHGFAPFLAHQRAETDPPETDPPETKGT